MSDSFLHAPQTAEKPTSASAANGNSSNGAQKQESDSSPSLIAESVAGALSDELATDSQHTSSSNGSDATPEAANNPLPDEQRPKPPSLTRVDLIVVAVMLAAIFVLSLIQLYRRYGWDAREIEVLHPAEYRFTLDINTATWVEWLQLDGVGEVLARRIVEYREQHGPFRSIDDLQNVHGIGDAKLDQMRPHLRLDSPRVERP